MVVVSTTNQEAYIVQVWLMLFRFAWITLGPMGWQISTKVEVLVPTSKRSPFPNPRKSPMGV